MARYIDADIVRKKIEALYEHHLEMGNFSADNACSDCLELLDDIPTADVVEVVRCKDCVKRQTPNCTMWYQCSVCGGQWSWENDAAFCSHGERRGT